MLVARRFSLGRAGMLRLLDKLEAKQDEGQTLYAPPNLTSAEIENLLGNTFSAQTIPSDVNNLISRPQTGAVLFWSASSKYLVYPPFPLKEKYISQGYDIELLRSLLKRDFLIALILVRLGSYAIGVCQGEKLVTSKVGTGLVHARHRQGGSSQARFARHRGKQIESFLTRVCGHVHEQIESYAQNLNYITYGGSRTAILLLRKECPFLTQFDDRELPSLLDIPDPRQPVLEDAIGRVWSSSIIEWREAESLPT